MPAASSDILILGAGAAGLFCAFTAARRGHKVRVLERANKVGKKILMSGGGRCNFTNLRVTADNFISANPHFCMSALARYKPDDFIALVRKHGIAFHEKELGQLFCDDSSRQIVQLLLDECRDANVRIDVDCEVHRVERVTEPSAHFVVHTSLGELRADKLVVATGGLSVPSLGGSGFGYELARQFGHEIQPTRASLVPFTLSGKPLEQWHDLSGLSLPVSAIANGARFDNAMLVTHRGLSGPAILQISNYWVPEERVPRGPKPKKSMGTDPIDFPLRLDLLPGRDALEFLLERQAARPDAELKTILAEAWPKRFAERFCDLLAPSQPMKRFGRKDLAAVAANIHDWPVKPSGTEGYRTAEVTLGGVDTREVSSTTFESQRVAGLYFIGEVLDVTGWLGGYNFQWAWASAHACGQAL